MNAVVNVLRGVSQIFFINNPLSGALILVALAFLDPRFSALVLFGSAIQTAGAWILGFKEEVRQGLMGYNGALVGAAAALYAGYGWMAILLTMVGSLTTVIVHKAVARVFDLSALRFAGLPVSTAPFVIVSGMLFGPIGSQWDAWPLTETSGIAGWAAGIANAFSEVMLADGILVGIITIVALAVGDRMIAAFGLLGAAIAVTATAAIDSPVVASTGLASYSAVLAAIAIGAVFWNGRSLVWRVGGAVVSSALTLVIQPLIAMTPIPVFTWPFLIAMWIVLFAGAQRGEHKTPVTS